MKKVICLLSVLLAFSHLTAQEVEFKKFTYSEFFQMMNEEKGAEFYYENAIVRFDPAVDTLFVVDLTPELYLKEKNGLAEKKLIIDKRIVLNNVHFDATFAYGKDLQVWGSINNIHFTESVKLNQTKSIVFINCIFDKPIDVITNEMTRPGTPSTMYLLSSRCKSSVLVNLTMQNLNSKNSGVIQIHNNTFTKQFKDKYEIPIVSISGENLSLASVKNNTFADVDLVKLNLDQSANIIFSNNNAVDTPFEISISANEGNQEVEIIDNLTDSPVLFKMEGLETHYAIPFMQFNNGLYSVASYSDYIQPLLNSTDFSDYFAIAYSDSVFDLYANKYMYDDKKAFDREMALMGRFHSFYKAKFAKEDANAVFIKMKDMETKKLFQTYQQNPSFRILFGIRINQILRIFSAYGTEPARVIISSIYIILIFGFFYLFFPNSWDVHGKNRIIHRLTFFMKYMNRNQGVHEVYLEDKQAELMDYDAFKSLIENSSGKVPGFFKATGLPLYRWAVSGTKITASLLSRIDVLKGTWEEVPRNNRWWKYTLIISAFLIAIIYDLSIKILNALMLSVNTFTTLGFGEIPIKGLPRYLAIIEGFIGWFMLTIFSVSLISQILN